MSKLNGPTRRKLYRGMSEDEGEFCKRCGVTAKERQLVIDHKDNDNSNNSRENRQFLCRPCNYFKNPRRPVVECVSESEAHDQSELQTSRQKEPFFRKFVCHVINEQGPTPEEDLIYSGAESVGISPVTASRYLKNMCSSVGILQKKKFGQTSVVRYKNELSFT